MEEYYIGVDLGTTGIKTVLYDHCGREIGSESEEIPLITPAPGWAEQSPECWYEIPCRLIKKLTGQISGGRVAGDNRHTCRQGRKTARQRDKLA